jgi:hypothetical protein
MKKSQRFYLIIKQIHLYSSLLTAALLLMYIITSYMMIHHDLFKVEEEIKSETSIVVTPDEINEKNWPIFLKENHIHGRLANERFNDHGDLIRDYYSTGKESRIKILKGRNQVDIVTIQFNLSGRIIGLHRQRGYGGPIAYNIYAFMLDIVGISLILFAITGVILWLKLLKFNKLAWTIFIFGFLYVGSVILYLSNN